MDDFCWKFPLPQEELFPIKPRPLKDMFLTSVRHLSLVQRLVFFLIFRCFDFGKSCMCEAGDVRVVKTV